MNRDLLSEGIHQMTTGPSLERDMAVENSGSAGPELDATEARTGRPGVPVLWVLVISTVVAVIAVALVWAFFAHGLSGAGGSRQIVTPAQAQKFDTPTVPASTKPADTRP
jgi:hypothetical protein